MRKTLNKRILALVLSIMMVAVMLPTNMLTVSAETTAETTGSCGTNATWEFDSSTNTLTISGSGAMDDIEVVDGGVVSPWGAYRGQIVSIVVEEGITHIGNYSFFDHWYVTTVDLPSTLTSIGREAFAGAAITEIALPNGLQSIGLNAFRRTKLQTVVLPDSVTELAEMAFNSCTSLTDVTLPNNESFKEISHLLFMGCTALKEVTIPSSVTYMGYSVFDGSGVTTVYMSGDAPQVESFLFNNAANGLTVYVSGATASGYEGGAWDNVNVVYLDRIDAPTVSFDANGGDAIDPITVTYGEKYGRLPSSAVTGLSGGDSNWYLVDENGDVTDVKITRNSIVETSGDHTLFVKRKVLAPTLKITLEVPGAISDGYQYYVPDNSTRILTVTVNNQNTDILDYTYQWYKDGVAIEGATDAVLTLDGNVADAGTYKVKVTATLKDESGIVVTENTASAEKEQVVKIMRAANTLYYDANGGEGGPSSNYTGGTDITVQTGKPTREGYVFGGWNTEADGTGESYDGGATYTFENDNGNGGCSVTLYAQWIKTYDVYVGGVQVTSANADDVLGDGTVSYDAETATLTLTDAAINNADGIGIKSTGDLTISGTGNVTGSTYGIYVDGMLSITSGSVIEMTGTENCALAVRDGILTDNIIVSVPKNYAMGSVGEEDHTTYGTYIEENDEYEFIPAKTVKLEPGYVIYFDVGESMDYIEYQEIVAGGKVERPADPTLSGYTFGGWYTDEAYTEAYDFDEAVTEELWLYAKWVPVAADDGNDPSDNTQTDNNTEENNKPNDSTQNEIDSGKEDNTTSNTTSPATGDNSNIWLWVALLFVSGGAIITLTVVDRKRRYTAKS